MHEYVKTKKKYEHKQLFRKNLKLKDEAEKTLKKNEGKNKEKEDENNGKVKNTKNGKKKNIIKLKIICSASFKKILSTGFISVLIISNEEKQLKIKKKEKFIANL